MKATTPLKALINLLIYILMRLEFLMFLHKMRKIFFYAAGYYAARDRLFQMSIVNFSVRGELSSALGDELIDSDIYLRTWRIHDTAKKLVGELDPQTVQLINAFCAGINYRIQEVYNDLPTEFKLLQIKPPVWNPPIVTGYARMMAREMSSSWKPEIVYGAIENYFWERKLKEIYPYYSDDHPTIASASFKNKYYQIL